MSALGRLGMVWLIAVSILSTACRDDPPEKEMQQAQGAIDAARAAGADRYAHDELVAATETLKRARAAVDDRDYRLALNNALDSREHAQNAAKQAADNKAIARADADRALAQATAALAEARNRSRAEAGTVPAKAAALRRAIADAQVAVQKARSSFDEGDYKNVVSSVQDVTATLRAATHDLENATATVGRRRR
jgi:hypothetical protein